MSPEDGCENLTTMPRTVQEIEDWTAKSLGAVISWRPRAGC